MKTISMINNYRAIAQIVMCFRNCHEVTRRRVFEIVLAVEGTIAPREPDLIERLGSRGDVRTLAFGFAFNAPATVLGIICLG